MRQSNSSDIAKEHNKKILGWVFGGIGIGIVLIVVGLIHDAIIKYNYASEFSSALYQLSILGFVVPLGFLFFAYTKKCPSCHALNAEVEDVGQKHEIGRKKGYRTRTDTHDIKNSNGDVVGKTENSYQVRVLVTTHRHYYHCKVCNHSWTKDKRTEDDEFDDED